MLFYSNMNLQLMINKVNVPEICHLLYLGLVKLWSSVTISRNISGIIRMIDTKKLYADFAPQQPFGKISFLLSPSQVAQLYPDYGVWKGLQEQINLHFDIK